MNQVKFKVGDKVCHRSNEDQSMVVVPCVIPEGMKENVQTRWLANGCLMVGYFFDYELKKIG